MIGRSRGAGRRAAAKRRTAPRVAATLAVEVICGDGQPSIHGQSLDIGTGGVCIETTDGFAAKPVSGVRVQIDASLRVIPGCVRWQRKTPGRGSLLSGLQFAEVVPEIAEELWSLMQARALQIARFLLEEQSLPGLDLDGALDLALTARRREFAPRTDIYRAGSFGEWEDSIFVIVNGEVDLHLASEAASGGAPTRLRAGSVFGGTPLVLGLEHVESARPATHVQALEIDEYSYERLCIEKPVTARLLNCAVAAGQIDRLAGALASAPRAKESATQMGSGGTG